MASKKCGTVTGRTRRITRSSELELELGLGLGLGLGFPILELPVHIVFDILTRLPVKDVFRCRCVCKAFRDLLLDPHFAKLYLTRSSPTLILHETLGYFIYLYLADLNDTPSSHSSSSYSDQHHRHLHHHHHHHHALLPNRKPTLVNSCNGFLCLYFASRRKPVYCVCNPVLGEYVILPPPPPPPPEPADQIYLDYSGFGFSPKTNQYKIIRFVLRMERTVVEVHTIGSESWRSIGEAPCPKHRGSFDPFVNGALHWITNCRTSWGLICSFDVESEKIQRISPPDHAHFDLDCFEKVSWINVGGLGGCLCLCYVFDEAYFEVWVMKDYGVKESWTRKFGIDIKSYCGLQLGDEHRPIGFMENGDMWMICHSYSLVSYSPQKRSFKDVKMCGIESKIEAIPHIPSFASLSSAVIGNNNLIVQNVKSFTQTLW